MNAVLGQLGLGSLFDLDGQGQGRLLLGGPDPVVPAEDLEGVASSAVALFGGGGESLEAVSALTGSLPQLAANPRVAPFSDIAAQLAGGAQLLGQLAANLPAVPSGLGTSAPARDLSKDQALSEAVDAHQRGEIVIKPAPTLDPSGAIRSPAPKTPISVDPSLAGVTFKAVQFADKRSPKGMAYAPVAGPLLALDVRHLVGLLRLARHLGQTWGVTEIHHAGVSGSNSPTGDCHLQGRACDLVGVAGVRDGSPFLLTVLNDWALKSVPDLRAPGRPRLPDWPAVTQPLEFRLASDPAADPFARDFFQDLYGFIASEFQDRSAGPGQTTGPTAIGQSSFIMSPDHPTSSPGKKNGREAHRGHLHFQIGPTGTQAP